MRVMVIFSNQDYACNETPFPPIGAVGTITLEKDEYGEYDVEFDGYPCPTTDGPSWVTHETMIVFLNDDKEKSEETEEVLYA